jgi:hypothetical protein
MSASGLGLGVVAQKSPEGVFSHRARSKRNDCLCSAFFGRNKPETIEFEKKYAHQKSSPLVAIGERMVSDNPKRIGRSQGQNLRLVTVGQQMTRARKRRLQEVQVANALCASMQGKQAVMQGERIALIDPDRVNHFDNTCKVFRYRSMMSSAWFIFFAKTGS